MKAQTNSVFRSLKTYQFHLKLTNKSKMILKKNTREPLMGWLKSPGVGPLSRLWRRWPWRRAPIRDGSSYSRRWTCCAQVCCSVKIQPMAECRLRCWRPHPADGSSLECARAIANASSHRWISKISSSLVISWLEITITVTWQTRGSHVVATW